MTPSRSKKQPSPEPAPAPPRPVIASRAQLIASSAALLLWLTFLMPDMAHIQAFFEGVGSGNRAISGPPLFSLFFYGTPVLLYHAWGWLREHRPGLSGKFAHPIVEGSIHALMLFLLVTNPGAPRGFIYFQF